VGQQDGEKSGAHVQSARSAVKRLGGVARLQGIGNHQSAPKQLSYCTGDGKPIAPAIVWQDQAHGRGCAKNT